MKFQVQFLFICSPIMYFICGCATHGPAYSGQENTLMVKPWLEEGEGDKEQFYLTGKVGKPYTYLAGEQNKLAGEGMIHFSASFPHFQMSYGIFGYFGGYQDTLQKNLPYYGIGIRAENNIVFKINRNLEFYPFGAGLTLASEFGSYTSEIDKKDTLKLKGYYGSTISPMSIYVTTGFRYKTPNFGIWQFQYARASHWSSYNRSLQFTDSDDLTLSGQFNKIILHSRISFNRAPNEIISTQTHWSTGITWAF